jgi:hypothetical protein
VVSEAAVLTAIFATEKSSDHKNHSSDNKAPTIISTLGSLRFFLPRFKYLGVHRVRCVFLFITTSSIGSAKADLELFPAAVLTAAKPPIANCQLPTASPN